MRSGIIDITVPLGSSTPVYPGDAPFSLKRTAAMQNGDPYNLSALSMSVHSGTHIDAPLHFLPDGASIDEVDPSRWISDAIVVDIGDAAMIGREHVAGLPLRAGLSVLFRTRNASMLREGAITDDFCALTEDAARVLAEAEVNLAGIDYLSIERPVAGEYPVHGILLGGGVLIAECLNLSNAEPGAYTLVIAPLLLEGADGAPARAFLLPGRVF